MWFILEVFLLSYYHYDILNLRIISVNHTLANVTAHTYNPLFLLRNKLLRKKEMQSHLVFLYFSS